MGFYLQGTWKSKSVWNGPFFVLGYISSNSPDGSSHCYHNTFSNMHVWAHPSPPNTVMALLTFRAKAKLLAMQAQLLSALDGPATLNSYPVLFSKHAILLLAFGTYIHALIVKNPEPTLYVPSQSSPSSPWVLLNPVHHSELDCDVISTTHLLSLLLG